MTTKALLSDTSATELLHSRQARKVVRLLVRSHTLDTLYTAIKDTTTKTENIPVIQLKPAQY